MRAAATGSDSDDGTASSVEIVLSMLRAASASTRRDIHRLLAAQLCEPPPAAALRVRELGFLSSLLDDPQSDGCEFGTCERTYYDTVRPRSAPSSRELVDRYGSWSRVCRAAYGIQADGTTVGPGKPWPTTNGSGSDWTEYSREEATAALRRCVAELRAAGVLTTPTTSQYDEWVRRHKLQARRRGLKLRLPYARNIYRIFPQRRLSESRWGAVLKAAGLSVSDPGGSSIAL